MIDAIAGAVIMVMATMSLVMAIEAAEKAFDQAGRHPLNLDERSLLGCCMTEDEKNLFEQKLQNVLREINVK